MPSTNNLAEARREVFEEIERFVARHSAAQNPLVREHLIAARQGAALVAGPLCLVIGRALGLGREEAIQSAAIVGLAEAAGVALRSLAGDQPKSVKARNGLPLALNSADALYSLAHLALAEFESAEGGRRLGVNSVFDARAEDLWAASLDTSGSTAQYFGDPARVAAAAGRLAGEVASRVAGRDPETMTAAGEFGARVANALQGAGPVSAAVEALQSAGLTPEERQSLASLVL